MVHSFFVITLKCTAEKRHTYLYWDYSGVEDGVATNFLRGGSCHHSRSVPDMHAIS